MTGLLGCYFRRTAGLVGVLVAVALIAAPAALANGDTLTAAANVNLNGVVDAGPTCSDARSITIHWGDGSTSAGSYLSSNENVLGNHTYGAAGSYSGKA